MRENHPPQAAKSECVTAGWAAVSGRKGGRGAPGTSFSGGEAEALGKQREATSVVWRSGFPQGCSVPSALTCTTPGAVCNLDRLQAAVSALGNDHSQSHLKGLLSSP